MGNRMLSNVRVIHRPATDQRTIQVDSTDALELSRVVGKLVGYGALGDPEARELASFVRDLEARYYAAKAVAS